MQPKTQTLQLCGITLDFTRKSVKNINLRVHADGSVAVSAPMRCPMARVEQFVAQKRTWILAAQARAHQQTQDVVDCTLTPAQAYAVFEPIHEAVFAIFAKALHHQKPVLKVRRMKASWGICAPQKHQITLNLTLAQKPPELIEYVMVHEYAHFMECNHSKAFWDVVGSVMPDWKVRRKLLNRR